VGSWNLVVLGSLEDDASRNEIQVTHYSCAQDVFGKACICAQKPPFQISCGRQRLELRGSCLQDSYLL
jgi:hypothetical protein